MMDVTENGTIVVDTSDLPVFRRDDVERGVAHWLMHESTAIHLVTKDVTILTTGIYVHTDDPRTDAELRALMAYLETRRANGENV